jgi:putative transposase
MPVGRPHRRNFNLPSHAHELTFTCYRGWSFFQSERTCAWLKDSIEIARHKLTFSVWAYVFMPEHIHLLVWPRRPDYDIAKIRGAIKEPVARKALMYLEKQAPHWLPRVTRKRGQKIERLFWQSGGGYDRNIESPAVLQAAIIYFHLNPVRRSLVERCEDWKWSSATHYSGGVSPLTPDPIPSDWID